MIIIGVLFDSYGRIVHMSGWVVVADPSDDVFDALRENHSILRDAELRELVLIAQACDESFVDETLAGFATERLIVGGADGTACIGEFLSMELGGLLGVDPVEASILIRDVLNLRDRHPELWAHTHAGRLTPKDALKVAQRCASAGLSVEGARWVDHQLALTLGALPWARVQRMLAGLIVKADAALAARRAEQRRRERHVYIGGHGEGASVLFGRLDTEDALALDQTISDVANALAAAGSTELIDQRRATALGILADPQAALDLLAGFGDGKPTNRKATLVVHISADQVYPEPFEDLRGTPDPALTAWLQAGPSSGWLQPGPTVAGGPRKSWLRTASPVVGGPPNGLPPGAGSICDGGMTPDSWVVGGEAVTVDGLTGHEPPGVGDEVTDVGSSGSRSSASIQTPDSGAVVAVKDVALDLASAHAAVRTVIVEGGVARIEGVGPLDLQTLRRFLGHTQVTVKPVVDLNTIPPVDHYEVPVRLRQHVLARNPVEAFPFSARPASGCDLDHTTPYDWQAPEGAEQTRADNLGPLSRRVHRAKTAKLWQVEQWQPGWYTWTSPHGFQYEVGPYGTTALGRPQSPDAYDE